MGSFAGYLVLHVQDIPTLSDATLGTLGSLISAYRGGKVAVMFSRIGRRPVGIVGGTKFVRLIKGRRFYPGVTTTLGRTRSYVSWVRVSLVVLYIVSFTFSWV